LISGGINAAYAWFGGPSGLKTPGYDWNVTGAGDYGGSVAGIGDVNGDGYSDVMVGASLFTQGETNEGAAWAYYGSTSGLDIYHDWVITSDENGAMLGYTVSNAGDVNGDGYSDALIGAPGYDHGHVDEGQLRLYYGSSSGLLTNPWDNWSIESNSEDAMMGYAVSGAGDINGDGFADILAGLPYYSNSQTYEGQARVYLSNGNGRTFLPRQLRVVGGAPIAPLGSSDWMTAFNLKMNGLSPSGRSKFKLEWEVKAFPTNFTGIGTEKTTGWSDTGVNGTTMQITKSGLSPNNGYHWRARLIYNMVANPFNPPHSRWVHMPWNGWNELDLHSADQYRLFLPVVLR
jgi:hypothetical protein